MVKSLLGQAIKSIFLDIILEIVYFPFWWYSKGLKKTVIYAYDGIKNTNRNLALTVMFKHMFRPMFGQYDKEGRIISFFMRLILIIAKSIVFIFFSIFYILIILFWIVLPVFVIYQIIFNLSSIWK